MTSGLSIGEIASVSPLPALIPAVQPYLGRDVGCLRLGWRKS